jgi:hypothetical protein
MAFCCDQMREQVERTCDLHPNRWDCPDCLVAHSPRTGEFGLMIHDGGTASVQIHFCPWCGAKLDGGGERRSCRSRGAAPDGSQG